MPEVVELKKQVEDMKKNKYSGDVENASTVDVKQVENISNKQRHTKYSQNTKYNYNTDIADIAREEYKRQKKEKRNQLLESFLKLI
ncbi:hypothetical protein M1N80_01440 [Peptococcaceae bacterium]|nr:hypothetical protein [Peptococcaceae bacterium]MCL0100464.1 hypothetical protein [Peptococcaceae bacterium]